MPDSLRPKNEANKEIMFIGLFLAFCSLFYFISLFLSKFTKIDLFQLGFLNYISLHHGFLYLGVILILGYLLFYAWPAERGEYNTIRQRLIAYNYHTPVASFVWDRNFKVVEWNPVAEKIFGYTKDEAMGKSGRDLIVPAEIILNIDNIFDSLINNVGGFRSTNENITKNGKRIICEWYNTPLLDENGKVFAVASLALDVTDRLKSENDNHTRLERAKIEQSAIVKLVTNSAIIDGNVEEAARVVTEMATAVLEIARSSVWILDSDAKELICLDLFEAATNSHTNGMILKAKDYPKYFEALSSGRAVDASDAYNDLRTSEFFESYLKPLAISSMLDAALRYQGKIIGVVCNEHIGVPREWAADDISFAADLADQISQAFVNKDRKEAQDALLRSEATFRQLTENIREVFWLSSIDKKTVFYISPVFEEIWGRSCESHYADPLSWIDTLHPEDKSRVFESIPKQMNGDYDIEFRVLRPDGTMRWVRDRAFPIKNSRGQPYRIAGIAEDITERKLAEEHRHEVEKQLRQSQKMEALGALAGGISHDFNNILSSIIGYAELIKIDPGASRNIDKSIDAVLTGAYRAKDLVKQILTFSRQTESKKEVVRLVEVIDEVVSLLQIALPLNIRFIKKIQIDCRVLVDRGQIYQVLMNLCTNSIYSMKMNGGDLVIFLNSFEEWDLRFDKMIQYARLSISDSGHGIPKELKDKIFDPFFTTKPIGEGTGLGLSVVHGVIKNHGGRIQVNSELGVGTTFDILLPLSQNNNSILEAITIHKTIEKGSEKVILVDDEQMVAELGKEILLKNGYRVESFTDALKVLEYLKANKDCDLLVTDLTMPIMNGEEVAKRAKKIKPGLKVILCSGYDPGVLSKYDKSSQIVDARVSKPFSINDFLLTVRSVLDKPENTLR